MRQVAFSFNVSRCSGCYACVVACQDQNNPISGDTAFRSVTVLDRETPGFCGVLGLSIACLHCTEAPCVKVCPSGAIFQNTDLGLIDVNQHLCIGCGTCLIACPFGAPKFTADGRMAKCNLCRDRLTQQLQPACVQACPTKALGFGPVDEISSGKVTDFSNRLLNNLAIQSS